MWYNIYVRLIKMVLREGTRVYGDRKELHNRKKTPHRAPGQQISLIYYSALKSILS